VGQPASGRIAARTGTARTRTRTGTVECQHPAAAPAERGKAAGVGPVRLEEDGRDLSTAGGEASAGVQGVAAVVAGADEQDHAGAIDRLK
jgi:hypothetical protein